MNLPELYLILVIVIILFMSLWFGLARRLGRLDVVDSAWGQIFVVLALVAMLAVGNISVVRWLALLFVAAWGFRLAIHIGRRNQGKPEDKRYQIYRAKWGNLFWLRAYFQIFLLQGALALLISTPLILIMQTGHSFNLDLAIVGFVVWASGIIIETIADRQLARFIAKKPSSRPSLMTSGLWHYSRHPNYFGEITSWWGAAIVAASASQYLGFLGAIVITLLIVKISGIPLLEKAMSSRPGYADYAKRTSLLVPLPPKR